MSRNVTHKDSVDRQRFAKVDVNPLPYGAGHVPVLISIFNGLIHKFNNSNISLLISDSSSIEFNICMPEMQSHDYYHVFVCHKCNHMITTLCLYAINAVT